MSIVFTPKAIAARLTAGAGGSAGAAGDSGILGKRSRWGDAVEPCLDAGFQIVIASARRLIVTAAAAWPTAEYPHAFLSGWPSDDALRKRYQNEQAWRVARLRLFYQPGLPIRNRQPQLLYRQEEDANESPPVQERVRDAHRQNVTRVGIPMPS